MKKIFVLLITLGMIVNISFADNIIYEKPDVKIIVDGENLDLGENVAIIVNSRTLVPLRKLLVGLGVPDNNTNIEWIPEKMAVKVRYNGVIIDLAIGSNAGYINGVKHTLDSAPIIYKDRTYLPAKFVGEALGYTLGWDSYTPAVIVTQNQNMKQITSILNELNTKMSNLNSYECISSKYTKSVTGDQLDVMESTTTKVEQADLVKEIIYSETEHEDPYQKVFTFEYVNNDALYTCYKYEEEGVLYNYGWKKYSHDSKTDKDTPYEQKEKNGLIKIDPSIYSSLAYKESNDEYIIYTPTSQLDALKTMDLDGLYEDAKKGNSVIKNFSFIMSIDKQSKLPRYLRVKLETSANSETIQGDIITSNEEVNYEMVFNKYNEYLKLVSPEE